MTRLTIPAVPTTLDEASQWVAWAVEAMGGYHPDTSASGYIVIATGQPTFTQDEAAQFDAGNDACHALLPNVYFTAAHFYDTQDQT